MADQSQAAGSTTRKEKVEALLSREPFKGLKAILDSLSADREALCAGIYSLNTYEDLLASLGYRVTLTKQIHVQDCYSRVGSAGGIKAVLPYYDIPTQSSLPTLINLDSSVTTTAKSAAFFNQMLTALKTQLSVQA
jgi:hypothetical protein